jgi:pentatricopeptide repeat protein
LHTDTNRIPTSLLDGNLGYLDAQEKRREQTMLEAAREEQQEGQIFDTANDSGSGKKNLFDLLASLSGNSGSGGDLVDNSWDMVHFGRAPDADYSPPLNHRRLCNKHRASLAFQHYVDNGGVVSLDIMNAYLSVHTEAGHMETALEVLEKFPDYGLQPNRHSFNHLIGMHIRNKDITGAMDTVDVMMSAKMVPDSSAFGWIIQALFHRDLIVEAIKVLEQAAAHNVSIPERDMRYLRARCEGLGITHPNITKDPQQWVKDVKLIRRQMKNSPQSKIQSVKSLNFLK